MKWIHRIGACAASVMAAVLLFSGVVLPVCAEGRTTIHLSGGSLQVGETLTVTVTATESADMSVSYDAGVLEFQDGGSGLTADGGTVQCEGTSVSLTFRAIGEGTSPIIVESSSAAGSSTKVSVTGAASAGEQTDTSANDAEIDGQFVIDGVGYVVSERYPAEQIPAGFERVTVTIDGYGYRELSNGAITLLYLKKASDVESDGTFYVYHEEQNSVSPFWMLGNAENYVLVEEPETVLSQRLSAVDGWDFPVYATGSGNGFFFVYGSDQTGAKGWYQYDEAYGTLQRVNDEFLQDTGDTQSEAAADAAPSEGNAASKDKIKSQRYLIAALLFLLAACVVVIINLLLARRRDAGEDEDWTEDSASERTGGGSEPEEDEEDDYFYRRDSRRVRQSFRMQPPEEENTGAPQTSEEESTGVPQPPEVENISVPQPPEIENISVPQPSEEENTDAPQIPEEAPEAEKPERAVKSEKSASIYEDLKGTEAFRSKKDTRYKSDSKSQLDILDLNDL